MAHNGCYHLRWNHHQPNFITVFKSLLELEELTDVTLSAEGKWIKAHKVILSACSSYFKTLFAEVTNKHPVVILSEIKYIDLKTIVDFIYLGEINVPEERLADLLEVAEHLQVKGLCENTKDKKKRTTSENCVSPSKKRKKSAAASIEKDECLSNNIKNSPKEKLEMSNTSLESTIDIPVDPKWMLMDSQSDYNSDSAGEIHCNDQEQNFEVTLKADYTGHSIGMHCQNQSTQSSNASKRGRKPGAARDSDNFTQALEAVRIGELGFCKAAKLYGVNNRSLWLEYKKRGYPPRTANKNKQKFDWVKTPS